MRNQLLAGVSRFAHLAGIGGSKAKAAKAADDDEKDKDKKEDAAAEDKDERAESDEDKENASTAAAADDDEDGDDDDDGEDDDGKKKGKAKSDDERCEDDDDKDKKAVRRGCRMERKRWSTVLSSKPAARNIELAVTLLADTSKSAEHIIGRLAASTSSSSDRRDRNPRIEVGSEPARPSGPALEKSWDNAFAKVGGNRR